MILLHQLQDEIVLLCCLKIEKACYSLTKKHFLHREKLDFSIFIENRIECETSDGDRDDRSCAGRSGHVLLLICIRVLHKFTRWIYHYSLWKLLFYNLYTSATRRLRVGSRRLLGVGTGPFARERNYQQQNIYIYTYVHAIYFVVNSFPPCDDDSSQYRFWG